MSKFNNLVYNLSSLPPQVLSSSECPFLGKACREQVRLLRVILHPADASHDDCHAAAAELNSKPKESTLISVLAASKLSKHITKDLLEIAAKREESRARSAIFSALQKQVFEGKAKLAATGEEASGEDAAEAITEATKQLKNVMVKVRQTLTAGGTWQPDEESTLLADLQDWMRDSGKKSLMATMRVLTEIDGEKAHGGHRLQQTSRRSSSTWVRSRT